MMKIVSLSDKTIIPKIIQFLKKGCVLVLPTDTVYGLVCDAENEKAVEKIFEIKKRDKAKPLAVFVKDIRMAKEYAEISVEQEKELQKFWPGKVTFILKIKNLKLNSNSKFKISNLCVKNGTIGMRVQKYKFLNGLLEKFGAPLAQTSANISGQPATGRIKEVLGQFDNNGIHPDIFIDAGDLPESNPSKIVDLSNGEERVLRY